MRKQYSETQVKEVLEMVKKRNDLLVYSLTDNEHYFYFSFIHLPSLTCYYVQNGDFFGVNLSTEHLPNRKTGSGWSFARDIVKVENETLNLLIDFGINKSTTSENKIPFKKLAEKRDLTEEGKNFLKSKGIEVL